MAPERHMGSALVALLLLGVGAQAAVVEVADCRAVPRVGCPATGTADLPLPCAGNCRSYARCKDGTWEKKTCLWPWTRFSPTENSCVMQSKVNCDWWKTVTTVTPTTVSTTTVSTTTVSTTTGPPTTVPAGGSCGHPQCPESGQALLPDSCPDACQHYYSCDAGQATPQLCLPWENFDPVSLTCVFWSLVDCTWANPTTLPPPDTTTPSTTTTTTTEATTTTATPCTFIPLCPSAGKALIADPCRCQAYFECEDGNAEEKLCLPWENFDRTTNKCVWFSDADCSWPAPTDPPTDLPTEPTVPTVPTKPPTEPTKATVPTDPPTEPTKPPTEPTPPTVAPTIIPGCGFVPDCSEGADLPIPCDGYCKKYVMCRGGRYAIVDCPWQKHFDSVSRECAWFKYTCAA